MFELEAKEEILNFVCYQLLLAQIVLKMPKCSRGLRLR